MKAFISTIEATIGAIIILGVMMLLFTPQAIQEQDMYEKTYKCLEYAKDFSDMNSKLAECLPSTYKFELKICETVECIADLPADKTITSAEYIDSGPRLIKVWVYK